jgi:hypothetical protein
VKDIISGIVPAAEASTGILGGSGLYSHRRPFRDSLAEATRGETLSGFPFAAPTAPPARRMGEARLARGKGPTEAAQLF